MIAVSDWHTRVGRRVSAFRAAHKLTPAEMVGQIGCGGPERLAAIEAGADDIQLDDLGGVGAVTGKGAPSGGCNRQGSPRLDLETTRYWAIGAPRKLTPRGRGRLLSAHQVAAWMVAGLCEPTLRR